jgi:hypothetical protein
MSEHTTAEDGTVIDQHSSDGVAFKESFQCDDDLYRRLRWKVIDDLLDKHDGDHVDLGKVQIRRFTFEDGVISYDATHPHVTHEDEMDGEIDV